MPALCSNSTSITLGSLWLQIQTGELIQASQACYVLVVSQTGELIQVPQACYVLVLSQTGELIQVSQACYVLPRYTDTEK